jgi:POT family proton-dependent oligopeptide transporter
MTEFWERFAFYGTRWALVLYIVAQFHGGDAAGEMPANRIYGAYLALVYASAIFGGYIADRVLGYQRTILLGAVVMAVGLFMIAWPDQRLFEIGLATIICGNGLFKPNISTMVGQLYDIHDSRRDAGFTIFYMCINLGAMVSPVVTQYLAESVFGTGYMPSYQYVFIASGVGMLLGLVWFWLGRRGLQGIGRPPADSAGRHKMVYVCIGVLVAIPLAYALLAMGAMTLMWILGIMFVALCGLLLVESIREGSVQRDKTLAMLIIFVFNVLFWAFYEQAGSSFTFLADRIVDRQFGDWTFPNAWFQSVNSLAIIALAPPIAMVWVWLGRRTLEPSIPRKFGLGLIFNALAFLLLMFALSSLVNDAGKIPFWTLFMVYVLQSIGELCLSPIGLSMVTKLAPVRLVGLGMGGWFLSTGIGDNLSGIFASVLSGASGMTTQSALTGYTFGFWTLVGSGVLLFLIGPLIDRLMHGVR